MYANEAYQGMCKEFPKGNVNAYCDICMLQTFIFINSCYTGF